TSGTIVGVGKKLKEKLSDVKIIAVEPEASAVLSGGAPGKHVIQGIGAGFIPGVYDGNIVDEIIQISNEKSFEFGNRMSKEEGLFLGISSGAAIAAAYEVAKRLGKGKTVLTISPDGGEKYLSTDMFK
ncbi:MAG: pyridoxal-phosphate dependent enzyme, partial [Leptotrichiaceae bacterium]|nr:pyridoxal-phosphate dependent enzyme [Leptotrichiaceae bacterium]